MSNHFLLIMSTGLPGDTTALLCNIINNDDLLYHLMNNEDEIDQYKSVEAIVKALIPKF